MPYIEQNERKVFDRRIDKMSKTIEHVGQLNYIITRLCHNWIIEWGTRYTNLNAVVGVLNCVLFEFYAIIARPYEDKKKAENGGITQLDEDTSKQDKSGGCNCGYC